MKKYFVYLLRLFIMGTYKIKSFIRKPKGGYRCPVCGSNIQYLLPYGTRTIRFNAECPVCRAAERDRLQQLFFSSMKRSGELEGKRVLHFAPEECMYSMFWSKDREKYSYLAVDIDKNMPHVDLPQDITCMSFDDNSFDIIICNQVLEHVVEDSKAIREISRCLTGDGVAIITVPIDEENETLCEDWINTDELRIKYYGEANHVRMYGGDFYKKLYDNGLDSKRIYAYQLADDTTLRMYGLNRSEFFWLCKKK